MAIWDTLISIGIILAIILVIFARVSGQTIGELLSDLRDLIFEGGEDQVEIVTQVYD